MEQTRHLRQRHGTLQHAIQILQERRRVEPQVLDQRHVGRRPSLPF